jgi:hypothetical protein
MSKSDTNRLLVRLLADLLEAEFMLDDDPFFVEVVQIRDRASLAARPALSI